MPPGYPDSYAFVFVDMAWTGGTIELKSISYPSCPTRSYVMV